MKNKEYLDNLPQGGIVTNKQVLAALKKMRLIFDYSFGYLEACYVYNPIPWGDGYVNRKLVELFPKKECP